MRTQLFSVILHILALLLPVQAQGVHSNSGEPPHIRPVSPIFQTNLNTTTSPQSAPKASTVFLEDTKMVDVTIYVSNQAELYEALKEATGGETILLSPGNYGSISLGGWSGHLIDFASEVTIRSIEPASPASFSGLSLEGVSNLTFDDVVFDYQFSASDPIWVSPFSIYGSSLISIQNSTFTGDLAHNTGLSDDGYGYGRGLTIRESSGISVAGNEFFNWHRAVLVLESDSLSLSGNNIHDIRSDGFNFGGVSNVLITDNYFHDFNTSPDSGDHADFIQFWTTNTDNPSSNITISSNILDVGIGGSVQGIFIGNELVAAGLAGQEMYYKNFEITNNILNLDHVHAVSVGFVDGLLVSANTIMRAPGSSMIPSINVTSDSSDVIIQYNAAPRISGWSGQVDWLLLKNVIIQNTDPSAPAYYKDIFIESSMFGENGISDYVVANESILDRFQAGSSLMLSSSFHEPVRAVFDVSTSSENSELLVLDARMSFGANGASLPIETTYQWTLPNGGTFNGPLLAYDFGKAGIYEVKLVVTTPAGDSSTAFAKLFVSSDQLLSFETSTGDFLVYDYGDTRALSGVGHQYFDVPSEQFMIDIDPVGTTFAVERGAIARLFNATSFRIGLTIQADEVGSFGEVFRLHSYFLATVLPNGDIRFDLSLRDGSTIRLLGQNAFLNDGSAHAVEFQFDQQAEYLTISVDGNVVASASVTGSTPSNGSWDLTFGNPWGASNFDSHISNFSIEVESLDFPLFYGEVPDAYSSIDFHGSLNFGDDETESAVLPVILDHTEVFKLNISELDSETVRLVGDAHVEPTQGGFGVHFDGVGDFVRFGDIDEHLSSSSLSLDISFKFSDPVDSAQGLVSFGANFQIGIGSDTIELLMAESNADAGKAKYTVEGINLADGDFHDLSFSASGENDRILLVLDGEVVINDLYLDFDLQFPSSEKAWWKKGWALADGGRTFDDFAGVVSSFSISDINAFLDV